MCFGTCISERVRCVMEGVVKFGRSRTADRGAECGDLRCVQPSMGFARRGAGWLRPLNQFLPGKPAHGVRRRESCAVS